MMILFTWSNAFCNGTSQYFLFTWFCNSGTGSRRQHGQTEQLRGHLYGTGKQLLAEHPRFCVRTDLGRAVHRVTRSCDIRQSLPRPALGVPTHRFHLRRGCRLCPKVGITLNQESAVLRRPCRLSVNLKPDRTGQRPVRPSCFHSTYLLCGHRSWGGVYAAIRDLVCAFLQTPRHDRAGMQHDCEFVARISLRQRPHRRPGKPVDFFDYRLIAAPLVVRLPLYRASLRSSPARSHAPECP